MSTLSRIIICSISLRLCWLWKVSLHVGGVTVISNERTQDRAVNGLCFWSVSLMFSHCQLDISFPHEPQLLALSPMMLDNCLDDWSTFWTMIFRSISLRLCWLYTVSLLVVVADQTADVKCVLRLCCFFFPSFSSGMGCFSSHTLPYQRPLLFGLRCLSMLRQFICLLRHASCRHTETDLLYAWPTSRLLLNKYSRRAM